MPIRVATAPVSWGILEVEGWGKQKPYGEVLDEMVEAGYSGTELGPYGFLPTDPNILKTELAKRKLPLLGAFVPLPLARADRHDAALQSALEIARLLAQAGAPYLVLADEMSPARMAVAGSVDDARDGMDARAWEGAARLLDRVARAARELGLSSVFHHHAGTFIETPGETERLLAMTDPQLLGLCLDSGHYFYGGGDPVDLARKHGTRVRHLHLKDVRPSVLEQVRREKIPYLDAVRMGVFCELGQGGVNLTGVIQELTAAEFDGWAVFEQDVDTTMPGCNPLESARRSRGYLRRAAGL
ncbi:MAG TPA: sugar phosphate isomerase/epimerase [Bryobacteraceae bacterium]|nr:sugar phosphate isomerase/epimerase [Bryobacteraceae bacterium]